MTYCENCKIELNSKNNSPSEIHSLCLTCWLHHKEAESLREYYKLRMKAMVWRPEGWGTNVSRQSKLGLRRRQNEY